MENVTDPIPDSIWVDEQWTGGGYYSFEVIVKNHKFSLVYKY